MQRHRGDRITDVETCHSFAHGGYHPGHLVTDRPWNRDATVHVAVFDVQIGATDAHVGNRDLHLSGHWIGRRSFRYTELRVPGVFSYEHAFSF